MVKVTKSNIKSMMKRLRWILSYSKKNIWMIALYTILGFSGTVVALISGLVSKDLVDIVTGHKTGELIKTFVTLILFQLFSLAVSEITLTVSTYVTSKLEIQLKEEVYDKIMSTKWIELSKLHSGEIGARFSSDTSRIASGILTTLPSLITSCFRLGTSVYMMARYDVTFVFFALVSVPISFAVSKTNLKRMSNAGMEMMESGAKMSAFIQDSFVDIQTVKAFDMMRSYKRKLANIQNIAYKAKMKNRKISFINTVLLSLVSTAIQYSTYGWGVYRVWSGVITYGTMTMFITLSSTLNGSIQGILNFVPNMISLTNSAQRLMDITELPKEDYSQYDEVTAFLEKNRNAGIGLCVRDASFAYVEGTDIFKNVGLTANPHEVVGLIGPSGEGKTTMLRLLLSIIDSPTGTSFVSRERADEYVEGMSFPLTASTRQLFAYVPQGNTMMAGTIAENMRNVKEDATDEEIVEALKAACAWEFVEKLPDGIYAEIKERGGGFSEGQSQRLSIARALLRKSPILLLDEATSALDMDTAKRVLDNILADTYPRTCIMSTHRPEVMDLCDRVYRIKAGEMSQI